MITLEERIAKVRDKMAYHFSTGDGRASFPDTIDERSFKKGFDAAARIYELKGRMDCLYDALNEYDRQEMTSSWGCAVDAEKKLKIELEKWEK